MKKIIFIFLLTLVFILFFFLFVFGQSLKRGEEGRLAIYFQGEKVGYEEYRWSKQGENYLLEVEGQLTKPVALVIEHLQIVLDAALIPQKFELTGTISGVHQEIFSELQEGKVTNRIRVAGQEQTLTHTIRRDAFLLPNPVFSPYLVLAKKFRCQLDSQSEPQEISIYVIPQVELKATIQAEANEPCGLVIQLGGTEVRLKTNPQGKLLSLSIPSQRLEVVPE